MQISDLVNQYNNNLASGSEISTGTKGVEQLTRTLQKLTSGQIFEGTVNSIKGNKVILGLSSGQNITATLDSAISLTKGQSVFFQVKSNDGNIIQIKPVSINASTGNPTILSALDAANLNVNERNINMVNNMMKESMPIDSQSLSNMSRIVSSNPNIDVATIVEMTKLDIPITDSMAAQFENYKSNESALMDTMKSVTDSIPELLSESDFEVNSAVNLNREIVSILTGADEAGANLAMNDSASATNAAVADSAINNAAISSGNDSIVSTQIILLDESGSMINPTFDSNGNQISPLLYDQNGIPVKADAFSADGNPNIALFDANGREITVTDSSTYSQVNAPVFNETLEYSSDSFAPNTIGHSMDSESASGLNSILKNDLTSFASQHPEYFDESGNLNPKSDVKSFMSDLSKYLSNNVPERESATKLFSSKAYKAMVSNLTQQQWMVSPEDITKEDAIKDLYKRLDANMQRLSEALSSSGKEDSQALKDINNIKSNIEFINQVNQTYQYVQIPFKMSNQNMNSDLYVYSNSKNSYEEGDKVTAFLHFDMDHLGTTDIAVVMQNGVVDTKFYLEDDASFNLIMNNIHILQKKIEEKGYTCSIDVVNDSKQVNLIEDFMKKDVGSSNTNLSRYSFDVRA